MHLEGKTKLETLPKEKLEAVLFLVITFLYLESLEKLIEANKLHYYRIVYFCGIVIFFLWLKCLYHEEKRHVLLYSGKHMQTSKTSRIT